MKNVLKRITSVFLAITIIFSSAYVGLGEVDFSGIFAVKSKAAISGSCGMNVNWTLDAGTLTISGTGNMTNYDSSSSAPWYSSRESIKTIVIGFGVKSIGSEAFKSCSTLTSVTIPDSVTSIGYRAFYYCKSLTSLTIPDSVTSIGDGAFSNIGYYNNSSNWENDVLYIGNHLIKAKTSLSGEYTIKEGTKTIAANAFYDCSRLTSVTIGDGVTSIGDSAFYYCSRLTSVTIPDSVISIGDYAFCYCYNLASVEIPDSVTSIGASAFSGCDKLTAIEIPDSVTSIGSEAFYDCESLTSVTIGDGVTIIGSRAFYDCESLTSVTIGDGVTSIGNGAFYGCTKLKKVYWNAKNVADFTAGSNVFYNAGRSDSGIEFICGDTVEKIPAYLFKVSTSSYEPRIVSVTIPDSVTSIGDRAFYDCSSLTSVTIGDGVTSIGDYAFYNTGYYNNSRNWENDVLYIGNHLIGAKTSLSGEYTIKEGTKTIANYAFSFTSLTSVTIPDSVTSIGDRAFYDCKSLESVCITDVAAWCNIDFENNYSTPMYYAYNLYINGERATDIVIPEGVTKIPVYAFRSCSRLTSVTIPDSVTSIGDGAFKSCSRLTSVTIPDSVTSIGDGAFIICESLTSVTIGDGVTSIGSRAFYDCGSLKAVTIPASVTYIGEESLGYRDFWGKVAGFRIYGVTGSAAETYANENGFTFKVICKHASTKWVTDKKATVNSAGKKYKECTECGEVLETAKIPQLKCSKPKLSKIENTADGVKITWGKVSGADKFEVYRKTSGGSYKKIGTTSKTYYTDKKASSGKKYYYYVKAVNEAGASSASSSKSIYYLADTTLSTPKSTKSGITLKWKKVTGADGYLIYRKTGSGSYSKIATVKGNSKVTYTDKSAKKGKTYTYKIKAYKSKTYSAYSNTKKIKDKY